MKTRTSTSDLIKRNIKLGESLLGNAGKPNGKHFVIFMENLPYAIMVLLGAAIFLAGFWQSFLSAWVSVGLYVAYGVVGIFWIVIFVCPYCHNFGKGCFSGHGQISAMFMEKKDETAFSREFKKNIPAIIPIYIIPVIAGGVFLASSPSYIVLILMVFFALDSYVAAPRVSKKYACAYCSVRDECPWMGENSFLSGKKKHD